MSKDPVEVSHQDVVDSARINEGIQDYIRIGQQGLMSFGSVVKSPDSLSQGADGHSTDHRPAEDITLGVLRYDPDTNLARKLRLDYLVEASANVYELQYDIGAGFVQVTNDGAKALSFNTPQSGLGFTCEDGHDVIDLTGIASVQNIVVRLFQPSFAEIEAVAWCVTGIYYSDNSNSGVSGVTNGSTDDPF